MGGSEEMSVLGGAAPEFAAKPSEQAGSYTRIDDGYEGSETTVLQLKAEGAFELTFCDEMSCSCKVKGKWKGGVGGRIILEVSSAEVEFEGEQMSVVQAGVPACGAITVHPAAEGVMWTESAPAKKLKELMVAAGAPDECLPSEAAILSKDLRADELQGVVSMISAQLAGNTMSMAC